MLVNKKVLFWGFLWFLGSGISSVGATIVPYLTLEQQIRLADRIVHGKILSKRSLWGPEKRHIYTDYRLKVLHVLKGKAGPFLTFRQLGGALDGQFTKIPGSANYHLGEEVVLFFERERKKGFLFVQGLAAGKYTVFLHRGKKYLTRQIDNLAFYYLNQRKNRHRLGTLTYSERPLSLEELGKKIVEVKRKFLPYAPIEQFYLKQFSRRARLILKRRHLWKRRERSLRRKPTLGKPALRLLVKPRPLKIAPIPHR